MASRSGAATAITPTSAMATGEDSPADGDRPVSRGFRDRFSASKLQQKFQDRMHDPASAGSSTGLQDRLVNIMLRQMLPSGIGEDDDLPGDAKRPKRPDERPNFSVPLFATNFRRFNARIGVLFVFQYRLIQLFSWTYPTETLSFLAVYTFCCLDPSLLAVVPLLILIFAVMVPAFLVRHPIPANQQMSDPHPIDGPAIAPPVIIKAAPEMSKDFFRNMRDLQNVMGDFTFAHDGIIELLAPLTNFGDERVSSTMFMGLLCASCLLSVFTGIVPWRAVFLLVGWLATFAGHPLAQTLLSSDDKEQIRGFGNRAGKLLAEWMNSDIVFDEAPEVREVEVFELQRQRDGTTWEPWVFGPSPYDPLSPIRISGDRAHGTRFFEDVQPPQGWEWSDKKWTLDLVSRDWVDERAITQVEVEIEGGRWVYDIKDEDDTSAYGSDSSSKPVAALKKQDWEEGTGVEPHGEWRRRRWVRLVKRPTYKVPPRGPLILSNGKDQKI